MSSAIAGLSSMATRLILLDLTRDYEARSGRRVAIRSMGGVEAARLIRAGEATDLVILASAVMSRLEAEGLILAGSLRGFARSGMAVAVRKGAPRPDLGGEQAVRDAVGQARAIAYSTGPSGDHLLQLCERWGVLPALQERLVQAPPGIPVGTLVARGEADLGFQQLSELLGLDGIEVAGPLPPDIQAVTVFSAGVCSASRQAADAADLIAYLAGREADDAKLRHGMEPARDPA